MSREKCNKLWRNYLRGFGLVLCFGLLCYPGLAQAQTVDQLMNQGREAIQNMWQSEDISYLQIANDKFKAAYNLQPNSQGANFHYALTRLAVLMLDPDAHALMDQAGITPGGYAPGEPRDPFDLTADFQRDADNRVVLPSDTPTGQDIANWQDNTLLPEIDGSIANLAMVDTNYSHIFPPEMTQADQDLEIDYADVQIFKAGLETLKASMQILSAYNCIAGLGNLADLVANVNNDVITNINTFLQAYPTILLVNDASRLDSAEANIRDAITSYNNGSNFMRNLDDAYQDDDFIVLDPEDEASEAEFRDSLAKINAALDGPQEFCTGEGSYHLDVTGNAYGTIDFDKDLCGYPHKISYSGFSVTGDGGGRDSGVEAVLPFATHSPPLRYVTPQVGQTWNSTGDSNGYQVNSTATVVSVSATITVPVGTFNNCAKVVETLAYPSGYNPGQRYPVKYERWFVPGLGPVKLVITEDNAAEYVGELTSYQNITAEATDYFPLGLGFSWTFTMNGGRTATWTVTAFESTVESITVDLSQFFDDPIDLKNYLPTLTDDDAVLYGSFPDPTFSDILPGFDQEGIARYFPLSEYYVNVNTGSDYNSGGSTAYPLKTITESLSRSSDNATIHVAAGTYNVASGEEFPLGDWVSNFLLKGAGAELTIIDASGSGQGVISIDGGAIEGFTVTGGNGWYGGIGCWGNATISNNIIIGNNGDGIGYGGNATISNNIIKDNNGTGIYAGSSIITDNIIVSNTSWSGGGITFGYGSPTIRNNVIRNNVASEGYGGGIYCGWGSSAIITNNIISGNKAIGSNSRGGGIYCYYSSPQITNCTINNNSAQDSGGGIYCSSSSSLLVVNSILWGNTAGGTPNEIYLNGSSSINITYSDINPSYITGPGTPSLSDNINSNPLFVGGGDYHLTANSPCIDAGNPDPIYNDSDGSRNDMGAYGGPGNNGTDCYEISLKAGWNLISLPLQPADIAIEFVLSDIFGKYASGWTFMNGDWKVYDPANPDFSDLLTMEAGWGYWINMNQAATLRICGTTPSTSISLVSGWNLVGYNSLTPLSTGEALASIEGKYVSVWAFIDGAWKVYDPANPDFSDLLTMKSNYGYWINATEACTWTLP